MRNAKPLMVLSAPFIYALIIPLMLLDVCVTIYQATCFPLYGIEKCRLSDFRPTPSRLDALEKLNCAYCSYANGLLAYIGEIGARTEAYWCPIMHARSLVHAHAHYAGFADFGDAGAYRKVIAALETAQRDAAAIAHLNTHV